MLFSCFCVILVIFCQLNCLRIILYCIRDYLLWGLTACSHGQLKGVHSLSTHHGRDPRIYYSTIHIPLLYPYNMTKYLSAEVLVNLMRTLRSNCYLGGMI